MSFDLVDTPPLAAWSFIANSLGIDAQLPRTVMARHLQPVLLLHSWALKPGDSMAMTCSKCKYVIVRKVTDNKAHIKMMTVGEEMKCVACDGDVVVVATGEAKGKHAEVKHVCSNCGDDAMFCTATKASSGSMEEEHGEHMKH